MNCDRRATPTLRMFFRFPRWLWMNWNKKKIWKSANDFFVCRLAGRCLLLSFVFRLVFFSFGSIAIKKKRGCETMPPVAAPPALVFFPANERKRTEQSRPIVSFRRPLLLSNPRENNNKTIRCNRLVFSVSSVSCRLCEFDFSCLLLLLLPI